MNSSWWKSFVAAIIWMLAASQAYSQPSFQGKASIESIVLNSDIVAVGKIVEVEKKTVTERGQEQDFYKLTLAVEETLKGGHQQRQIVQFDPSGRKVVFRKNYFEDELADLKKNAHRLLVAIEGESEPLSVNCIVDLDESKLEVFAADFTVLRKPEDVLRAAKETLRRAPGVRRIDTFRLEVPTEGGYCQWGGQTLLEVPVDGRLEKRAHEYLQSKVHWQRQQGIDALEHFKTDENIEYLKTLLSDPDWWVYTSAESNHGIEVRHYYVRESAYRILRHCWGVTVAEPVTSVDVEKFDSVREAGFVRSKVTVAALKELQRFKNLEDLTFRESQVTDVELKELVRFKNLRGLDLACTKVNDASLQYVIALPNLRFLNLAVTKVTDAGMAEVAKLRNLEGLDIEQTSVGDAGLKTLAGCANLSALALRSTLVTSAGLRNLKGLKKLDELTLDDSQITDATLRVLREMDMLHALSHAYAKTPASYESYQNPPRAKSEEEVDELSLNNTPVTDLGLEQLIGLKNLANLDLVDSKVTDAGVARLQKALPKCKISYNAGANPP